MNYFSQLSQGCKCTSVCTPINGHRMLHVYRKENTQSNPVPGVDLCKTWSGVTCDHVIFLS